MEGAILDSDHYPLLEELGSIGIAADDEGGPPRVEEITGFDGVVRFGGIGSASQTGHARVGVISGFNAVERLEGTLAATADVTGFLALTEIDGDLSVKLAAALGSGRPTRSSTCATCVRWAATSCSTARGQPAWAFRRCST